MLLLLAFVFLSVTAVLGLGAGAAHLLGLLDPREQRAERVPLVLAATLGVGLLPLVTLALSALGGLRPLPLVVVLSLLAAGFAWSVARGSLGIEVSRERLGWLEWALLVPVCLLSLAAFLRALAPPTAWDAVAYHLALAKRFAAAGSFVDSLTMRQARWPLGIDALYTVGESLGGFRLSGWYAGLLGLVATFTVFALGAEAGRSRKAGLLAAAIFAGSPVVAYVQGVAYAEAGLAALVAGAMLAALRHVRTDRRADAAAAGLLAGAAAAVKYTGLVWPPLVAVGLLVSTRKPRRALLALALAALVSAPWYARTWKLTGNPIWPYAYATLGGKGWNAEHAERLARFERSSYGHGTGAASFALAPFRLTFDEARFDTLVLGPLFLALLPLAIAGADRRRAALLIACGGAFVAWFLATQQARFLVPILGPLAAAIAGGLVAFERRPSGRAGSVLAVAGTAAGLVLVTPPALERIPVLTGRQTVEAYLDENLSSFGAQLYLNRVHQPRPERVLLFREIRGYWLDVPYEWGDPLNQTFIDYHQLATATDLHERLRGLGIDVILVNDIEYPPSLLDYDDHTVRLMNAMLSRYAELVRADGRVKVYKLIF